MDRLFNLYDILNVMYTNVFGIGQRISTGDRLTSGSRGGALGARAPVIQFGGPVYNLRAKQ